MLKDYLSKLLALAVLLLAWSFSSAQTAITIDAPASIAGTYTAQLAAFGTFLGGESASLVLADDGAGATTGCTIANDMTGAIALIDRGTCGFAVKVANAQAAGAIAVIVCNNSTTAPDDIIAMGGANCDITIPSVMISYNNCQIIKAELANGVTATMPDEAPTEDGQSIVNPIALPGAGTYTADTLTGTFSVFTDAVAAKVYSIVAPMTGVMNVNSCNGGADTRVAVLQGCRNALVVIGDNDDACEIEPGGDPYASSLDVIVTAGETYLIHWDDHWDANGFGFEVSFGDLPNVDVTFNVDMKNETVAADGVKIVINGTEADMTDDGDGTWSYTANVLGGSTLDYSFDNSTGGLEDNPDVAACRSVEVGLEPVDVDLVCYNSCFICPPDEACPSWIKDDFEAYTLSEIGPQSANWDTWTFDPGGGDHGVVSAAQANSGSQSLEISEAGADDVLLLLGDRTSGNYILKWKMYVPAGSSAYYNIQKFQNQPGATGGFAMQATFNADGTGDIDAGATSAATFAYPQGEWFEVYQSIDLDNDWIRMWVAGETVYEWPISWETGAQTGTKQLGAIDFYGNTGNLYYIDDVLLKEIEACPANAIICDGFDGYEVGATGPQSPWWSTWSFDDGGAEDGVVNSTQFLSCEQAMEISDVDPDDVLLLLGDRTDGNYTLSWMMYVPTGHGAYYNLQKFQDMPGATGGFATEVVFNADGTGIYNVGNADIAFNYPHDEWFEVHHSIDVDNDWCIATISGVEVTQHPVSWQAGAQSGTKQIGGVDFFGFNTVAANYWVDDVRFIQLPSVPGNLCGSAIDLSSYLGQGQGTTTATPLFDNTNYSTVNDPTTGWECFGEPDGGGSAPSLEKTIWYTFVGDGQTYFIETGNCGATDYIDDGDTQMAIYTGGCGALTPVDCDEDSPNATVGNYISGLELATTVGTTYYMMIDGFNFQGAVSDGQYCINYTQLTGTPVVDVTFQVDASNITVSAQGMKIRGSWNNYANENMTNQGNGIWSYTRTLFVDEVVTYRFSNGNANLEPGGALSACGEDVNGTVYRSHTAGPDDETLPAVCFGSCLPCGEAVQVTFQVDLTYYLQTNALETVKIAGNFADNGAFGVPNWDPPSAPLFTSIGDDVWSTTIEFPTSSAGQSLEFKFLNTADSWGDCGVKQECMGAEDDACKNPSNDNRLLVIPSANETLCYTWETCLGCNVSNTNEKFVEIPMTVAPNPFSNRTVVTFHNGIVDGKLRLSALTGQVVRTYTVNGTQVIIEKDDLTPGIYFINVVTEAGTSVAEKLIVE